MIGRSRRGSGREEGRGGEGVGGEGRGGEGEGGEGVKGEGGKGGGLDSDEGQFVTFHPSRYTTVASNAMFSEQRACKRQECGSRRNFKFYYTNI
jgi:hypothetical protein